MSWDNPVTGTLLFQNPSGDIVPEVQEVIIEEELFLYPQYFKTDENKKIWNNRLENCKNDIIKFYSDKDKIDLPPFDESLKQEYKDFLIYMETVKDTDQSHDSGEQHEDHGKGYAGRNLGKSHFYKMYDSNN